MGVLYELVKKNPEKENGFSADTNQKKFVSMEEGFTGKNHMDEELVLLKSSIEEGEGKGGDGSCDSSKRQRLVSLDVFRGFTVGLMILVDDVGGFVPAINHSPWNGVTLADFVMPFFLFIVGVSLALTYKKNFSCTRDKFVATRKALLRTLKLFFLGLVLQGGYLHGINELSYGVDIDRIRWMGTLQRIAIAYFVTALCEIWLKGDDFSMMTKYKFQWILSLVLTIGYAALLYGAYVSDWEYEISGKTFSVECGVRGDTGPSCNVVGMLDRKLLGGIRHLYRNPIYARTTECSINSPDKGPLPFDAPSWCQAPFEPEGLLSSVMAIVTCLLGLHFGHVIVHVKEHKERIMSWMMPASGLVFVGFILDCFGIHLNKALYTISYTCVTTGAAGVLLAGTYVIVDVLGYRRPTIVLEWMGKHALMIYILAACNVIPFFLQGFYWKTPENNILSLLGIGSHKR